MNVHPWPPPAKTPPPVVKIGVHTYTVHLDDTGTLRDDDKAGETRSDRLTITIDGRDLAHTVRCETVLHEILHAVIAQTGIDLDSIKDDLEEQVVAAVAPVLLDVLRSNDDLVRYLRL